MSCQVHRADNGEILESSHNGLLYGLTELCKEPAVATYFNDIEISKTEIKNGIRNYEDPTKAHPSNQVRILQLQNTRPDHLEDAVAILRDAKAGGYALRLE